MACVDAELKTVASGSDHDAPRGGEAPAPNLADTLAKAMAARRGAVSDAPAKNNVLADDDDDDDDDWE